MTDYDNWKLASPEDEEPAEFECMECSEPVEHENSYCSSNCFKASEL